MKKLCLGIVLTLVFQFAYAITIEQEWFEPLKTIDNFVSLTLMRNYLRALHHWNTIRDKIDNSELTVQEKASMESNAQRINNDWKMFKKDLEQDEQANAVKEYFDTLVTYCIALGAEGSDIRVLEREFLKNLKAVWKYRQEKRARMFMQTKPNHLREFARDCKEDPKKFNFERAQSVEKQSRLGRNFDEK